jgi:hypothetical protein
MMGKSSPDYVVDSNYDEDANIAESLWTPHVFAPPLSPNITYDGVCPCGLRGLDAGKICPQRRTNPILLLGKTTISSTCTATASYVVVALIVIFSMEKATLESYKKDDTNNSSGRAVIVH